MNERILAYTVYLLENNYPLALEMYKKLSKLIRSYLKGICK